MHVIIKLTEPNDDWEGLSHTCNNAAYHSLLFNNYPDNCPTCEKILNRYYVKYLESLLTEKYPNHEKYVSFTVGPENSDSFDGWVVFFFKSDLIEGSTLAVDWSVCTASPSKPPKILREKSSKHIRCYCCGEGKSQC